VSGSYWPDDLGVIHTGTRAEPIRSEPIRTAPVVRRSTDAPVIPLRLSWQPNPFRSLRVALHASCHVAVVVGTERRVRLITLVASRLSTRYALDTWRVRQLLATRLRRHSHWNPSRADQIRTHSDRPSDAQVYGRTRYTSSPILTA